jgi:hypothetical protein
MISNCRICVGNQTIELQVRAEATGEWRWSVLTPRGNAMEEGSTPSKLSAQIISQRALEERLRVAGLAYAVTDSYEWKDLGGAGSRYLLDEL